MSDYKTPQVSMTPDQLDSIMTAERLLHDTLPQLDSLEKCGVNCQLIREQAMREAEKARNLRSLFAPK